MDRAYQTMVPLYEGNFGQFESRGTGVMVINAIRGRSPEKLYQKHKVRLQGCKKGNDAVNENPRQTNSPLIIPFPASLLLLSSFAEDLSENINSTDGS